MEIVGEEMYRFFAEIGPWHIGTSDEYISCSLSRYDLFCMFVLLPVTIAENPLENSNIRECIYIFLWNIPEHRLM